MRFDLPYKGGTVPLEVPDSLIVAVAEPGGGPGPAGGDAASILAAALASPLGRDGGNGGQSLEDFLRGARSVLVIVNDSTRPTPSAAMLEALAPALGDIETTVLVATGAHRGATEEEYSRILGNQHSRLRPRARSHDARDASCLVDLGRTSRGTPVLLNRLAAEADRVIATGSVEPHYFAGFTGGRKAFFPGVAGFATIEANHRLALDSRAASLALGGNPVHEDLVEALSFVRTPVFSLMAVLDGEQRVAAATSGDITGSFAAAVAEARRIFSVPVPRRAAVVLSVAREPMDIDLYQSQKAIDNGAAALADGGTLILLSSCREGIGDKEYAALLASSADPAAALEAIGSGYRLGWHKAAKMAQVSARATVQAKTELDGKLLRSLFIEPVVDLQEAVDRALARRVPGCAPGLILLPDGCLTVPDPAGRPQAS